MNFSTTLTPAVAAGPAFDDDAPMTAQEEVPVVARLFRIAMRWKWVIAGIVAAVVAIGLVVTLLTTPQYMASALIEIAREGDQVVNVGGVEQEVNAADQEFYQTQYGLLKSKALAERVARTLRLSENPDFFKMYGHDMAEIAPAGNAGRRVRERRAGEILIENVDIAPVRLSRLVNINVISPDPALAARIANAWATNFIQSNLERRFESTSYARTFLEDRLAQLRTRLEDAERQLVAYAQRQRIVNVTTATTSEGPPVERPLAADELTALNNELAAATADRIRAQARAQGRGVTSEAFGNQAIGLLRQRRAELTADYAKLMQTFEPGYAPARAIQTQIAELDRQIGREEARARDTLQTTFRESVNRERELQARVAQLESGLLDLRRRSIQYNIYQRDVDTTRELYNGLLQRYKEIGVAGGVGSNNVSVIDEAKVPQRPTRPNLLVNLLLSLLVGAGLAGLAVFVLEQLDESIADPADVQRRIGLPLLGTIATIPAGRSPLEELGDRKSQLVDAYLAVQTNLEFATAHGFPRTLTVSSTRPAEGKSTTALALAVALARSNRRTLLIDGDMRSPSVHQLAGVKNDRGLTNFLAGGEEIDGLLRPIEQFGLTVMPAGPLPPNAAELLVTDRLERLLEKLLERFDHVVIDAPPVMGLADAPLIASRVEGVVFVVESHAIRVRLVKTALGRLAGTNARIFGTVLTKFDANRAQSGYGYEYGYGYGSQERS
jgi:polysaccharide biosynthesis transport protein